MEVDCSSKLLSLSTPSIGFEYQGNTAPATLEDGKSLMTKSPADRSEMSSISYGGQSTGILASRTNLHVKKVVLEEKHPKKKEECGYGAVVHGNED